MKKHLLSILISTACLLTCPAWASSPSQDAADRLNASANVLKEIASDPDKGIPSEVVKNAKCVVVVPHLLKAGLIAGGKYGHGVAVCRATTGKHNSASKQGNIGGWSAPAFITIGGGSWGPQIGAESVDLVMMVMNDKGVQQLLSDKVQMSMEGSAAAGPVGRHATVGSDWKGDTEILTYARSKGAFAGQTLEGAVIEPDQDAVKAVYGSEIPVNKILLGSVPVPASATPFLQAVAEISRDAAAQNARQQTSDNMNPGQHK